MWKRNIAGAMAMVFVPSSIFAGNAEPFAYTEPQVVNFRTVVSDLMSARSTVYAGGSGSLQSTGFGGIYSQSNQDVGLRLPLVGDVASNNFTVFFGARRSAHNFIFGAEMFLGGGERSVDSTRTFQLDLRPAIPNIINGSASQTARIGTEVGMRAIVGYEYEGLRFYGSLGLAGAGVTTSVSFDNVAAVPVTRTMIGAHYALGMEFQASRDLSIRLEVSQSNFGGMAYPVGAGNFNSQTGTLDNVATHSLSISATNLTLGALFEF